MILHVALVTDDTYLPWCATAVRSCLDSHPEVDLHVHVVHDGTVTDGQAARLSAMVEGPARVSVHAVDPASVAHLPSRDRFGPVVWLRFLLPTLLPDVDRVVYLDADTLVVDDLRPLRHLDLDGCPLGAVPNVVPAEEWPRLRGLGLIDPTEVLNSGVLVMDLARLRAEDLMAQVADAVAAFGPAIAWPDQDVLNLVFAGRWRPLHPRFNVQNSMFMWPEAAARVVGASARAGAVADPAVLHFEGPATCKPWHALAAHPWTGRYRATLARTPWAGTPLDDDGPATRALAHLPERWQLPAYRRLVRARAGHRPSLRTVASAARTAARVAVLDPPPPAPAPSPTAPEVLSTASDPHRRIVQRCLPYTMGSIERLLATVDATDHVVARGVPGALVECGVWRGGSVLAMVLSLQRAGVDDRDIYLFDTFSGMTAPGDEDTSSFHGPAVDEWERAGDDGDAAYGALFARSTFGRDQVERLLATTGYPPERIHVVEGPVEETLPAGAPDRIALLRLDTDWYSSTDHEMTHLYPLLETGGVLIVDDYGHWEGARKAVDEHLAAGPPLLLTRSDYTGRLAVKR